MNINVLTNLDVDHKEAMEAIQSRADEKDWYVLKYDMCTTDYNNQIIFKTLGEAWQEFQETESSYPEERIELIFSPQDDDPDFGDNIVVNYKMFKGGERLTSTEAKLLDWANDKIDSECELRKPEAVIADLAEYGFNRDELIEMNFKTIDIDPILPDLPDKVTLNEDVVEKFDYDDGDVDDESLQEYMDNYLSDEYGYCVNDYNYKCHYNEDGKLIGIDIYNIDWDLSE